MHCHNLKLSEIAHFLPFLAIISVAELCVKKRYGDDNVWEDSSQEDKLSKRQLSVMRIKRGQRSIFRRICELVVEENSQG